VHQFLAQAPDTQDVGYVCMTMSITKDTYTTAQKIVNAGLSEYNSLCLLILLELGSDRHSGYC